MYWIVLLGIATGMRTMTAMAVICWFAYLGYMPVEGTWAFWTAKLASLIVFTALALGEYVGDTLPRTPSRTDVGPVMARLSFGAAVGAIAATVMGQPKAGGILFAVVGVLIGTYGGYRARAWGARIVGHDLPVALTESALALVFSVFVILKVFLVSNADAYPMNMFGLH